jgi:glucosamine--fructose-6-phosphate aminotransferase (isomerizing)
LLLDGLKRLEYRGYDSSGIAVVNGKGLEIAKAAGKISALEQQLDGSYPPAPSASRTPVGLPTGRLPPRMPILTPISPGASPSFHNGIIENASPSGRHSSSAAHLQVGDRPRGAGAPGR